MLSMPCIGRGAALCALVAPVIAGVLAAPAAAGDKHYAPGISGPQ